MNTSLKQVYTLIGAYSWVAIVLGILTVVALWRIFTKAGQAGWKALIPIYNLHIFAGICWKASYFWYSLLASCVLAGVGSAVGGTFGSLLSLIGSIVSLLYTVYSMIHLSRRFGKSGGFTVCLVLFNTICLMILGFGSADYSLLRDN